MIFQKSNGAMITFLKFFVTSTILFSLYSCIPTSTTPTTNPSIPGPKAVTPTSNEFYVDGSSGSDSNPGTISQPWKTIQKASNDAYAGETITVLAGNYDERVQVGNSGLATSPITFQGDGIVTMHGFTIRADFITIRNFQITNTPDDDIDGMGIFVMGSGCDLENNYIYFATRGGIDLSGKSSGCEIKNNRLDHNSQFGITIQGSNHVVEGNEIRRTIQYHPAWITPPTWVDADGIHFFGSGHIIRGNYIHDINYSDPENVNPHIDCFQTWQDANHAAASNIIIEQNRCDNAAQAHSTDEGGTGFTMANAGPDIIIRNNIVKAFADVFISKSNGISILNDTLVSDTTLDTQYYPVGAEVDNSSNITIVNNIFFNQPGQIIYIKNSNVTGEKNIVFRDDGLPLTTTKTYNPQNDLWGIDPLFINSAANDYHLQVGSPAIDAGVQVNDVSNDYDGNTRPIGRGFDIGAYEFTGK
jgi:parallel beta-helix repeat protein